MKRYYLLFPIFPLFFLIGVEIHLNAGADRVYHGLVLWLCLNLRKSRRLAAAALVTTHHYHSIHRNLSMRVSLTQAFRLAALVTGCLFASTSHAQLVGHWNFDNNDLTESSGFADAGTHDGVAVGPVAFDSVDTPTGEGSSLDLTGVDSFVKILNSDANDPTNTGYQNTFDDNLQNGMSIAFFSQGIPGRWAPMISKFGEDNDLATGGYQIRMRNRGPSSTFTLRGTAGEPDPQDAAGTADDITGEWQHFAGVWDPTEQGTDPETGELVTDPDTGDPVLGTRKLYVDGVLIFTVNGDSGPYAAADNFALLFGARDNAPDGTNDGNIFTGKLDEIYIYQNAITEAEVQALAGVESVLLGDCDLNGVINFDDIAAFISILSGTEFVAEADCNVSGDISFDDIGPFIAILSAN